MSKRKSKINEIYQIISNTLASNNIHIKKSNHLSIVTSFCNLKGIPIPLHFTLESLKSLLSLSSSPIPLSSINPTVKKKRTKTKAREPLTIPPGSTKQQVADIYRADLVKFATRQERRVKSLIRKINKEITELRYEFQKIWIDTQGKEFYISDFVFPSLSLSLEIDGSSHNEQKQIEKDTRKEFHLLSHGINTIRVTNKQVDSMTSIQLYRILIKKKQNQSA